MQTIIIMMIKTYRLIGTTLIGPCCRFEPSCSSYALQALEIHGLGKGSYLGLRRILRCHPWCAGGSDPVP